MPRYNQAAFRSFQASQDAVLLCAITRSGQGGYIAERVVVNIDAIHAQTPTNQRAILRSLFGPEAVPAEDEVPEVTSFAPEVPEVVPSAPVRTRKPVSRYAFRPDGEPARGATITYKKQYGKKAEAKKLGTRMKRNQTIEAKKKAKEKELRAQGAKEAMMKAKKLSV